MTTTVSITAATDPAHERRVSIALFAAGLCTFGSLFSAQALLPSLSLAFDASPAHAALAVSLTSGCLASAIVPMSLMSGRFGRIRLMTWSVMTATIVGLLLPLSPSLELFLAGRAAQGIALAGVPAVAMAFLAEEVSAARLGAAMGMYIAGNTVGGLAGRLIPAALVEVWSWRWAAAAGAFLVAACSVYFVRVVPPAHGFTPRQLQPRAILADLTAPLRQRISLSLYGIAFVLMGGFVSLYNYLGYRLIDAPFEMSPAAASLVFLLYLAGTVAAPIAGRQVDGIGRTRVLAATVAMMAAGLVCTVPDRVSTILLGVLLCTAGFFGAHTVAGAWVSTAARGNRGAATSLYLFAYYVGGAFGGTVGGLAFEWHGWPGIACWIAVLVGVAAMLIGALAMTTSRSLPGQDSGSR